MSLPLATSKPLRRKPAVVARRTEPASWLLPTMPPVAAPANLKAASARTAFAEPIASAVAKTANPAIATKPGAAAKTARLVTARRTQVVAPARTNSPADSLNDPLIYREDSRNRGLHPRFANAPNLSARFASCPVAPVAEHRGLRQHRAWERISCPKIRANRKSGAARFSPTLPSLPNSLLARDVRTELNTNHMPDSPT